MTPGDTGLMLELTAQQRAPLAGLVEAWLDRRQSEGVGGYHGVGTDPNRARQVEIREVEVLLAGRPGLLDVLADVDGQAVHAVIGVRSDGGDGSADSGAEGRGLGLIHDDEGLAVAIDALHDPELAPLVLTAVTGQVVDRPVVSVVRDDDEAIVVDFSARSALMVFPRVTDAPHRGVEMLLGLDEAGFNHLPAPLAVWRRGGRDLGVAQEVLGGAAGGWALALTSLRDLFGSAGPPEEAGGDFGPEAQALGTMTGRMHVALERAFGRAEARVQDVAEQSQAVIARADPALLDHATVAALDRIGTASVVVPAIRTHGDFHLGKTARTDLGWVVSDCLPGGRLPGNSEPSFRLPLADVADMLWSMHYVSAVAAAERDPSGQSSLTLLAKAWAERNRGAYLTAYFATPGIVELIGLDHALVHDLTSVLEVERTAERGSQGPVG